MDSTKPSSFDVSKLVFLGILLAAVAAVWVFSAGRTTLTMAPVAAACGELTVSMPSGPYWQSTSKGKWTWQPNALVQKSVRGTTQDCTVEVQYQLSPITVEPEQYLAAAATAWRLEEVGHGQHQVGETTLTWAAMATQDEQPGVYYGVAPLGTQRMLTVWVAARPGASLLAGQVFDAVLKSLKYNDTGLAQKGADIVKMIQADGLSSVTTHFPSQTFAVRNSAGTEIGFILTRPILRQNEAVIDTLLYDSESAAKFSRTRAATPDMADFSLYTWRTLNNPAPNMAISVQAGMLLLPEGRGRLKSVPLSDAAIPRQIIDLSGWKLLQSNIPEAIVDMVGDDGEVDPVRVIPGKSPADPNSTEVSVIFTYVAGKGVSSEVFFDPNGVVVRSIDRSGEVRSTERTTTSHIKELFPDLVEDIDRFMSGSTGTVTRPKEIEYGKPI
jgi:hypothetical protein